MTPASELATLRDEPKTLTEEATIMNRKTDSTPTKLNTSIHSAAFLVTILSQACGGNGGGDSGSGGDGGTDTTGQAAPDPKIYGDLCGEVTDFGFEISCLVSAVEFMSNSQALLGELQGCPLGECGFPLATLFPNATPCCEGSAPVATADAECQDTCMLAACLDARRGHQNIISSTCLSPIVADDGFDLEGCMTGGITSHTFNCSAVCLGIGACGDSYNLQVTCSAQSNETYNQDGTFGFIDEDPNNDPSTCMGSSALTYQPGGYALQDSAEEALGSHATVAWSTTSSSGVESTADISVDTSYDLVNCPSGTCLQLAQLDIGTSDFTVEGISVTSPRLSLIGVGFEPSVNGEGSFSFPAGTLEVLVEYVAFGSRQHLVGTNSGTMVGRIVPGSNLFSLSNLQLDYADSGISTTLALDIVGSYTKRAPVASFVTVSAPRSCSQPVVFDATSTDEDGDPLSHHWEVDGQVIASGDSLSIQLAGGAHSIILLAEDDDGRLDVAVMEYNRACT